ncbi:AsnC family transcriptional regulator [Bacillus sp. M6-12]|uniref:Lrp/AsnC family transcriptional regulator n=1 Tax=Bacillus sp. M6-12 TaxID=2054166 RepID=UPI000C790840|nr:Lrp/AsnC family transcriptional regulator [Bacillus sp. M6-12]PLS16064.1 AsnC family transcriptional regulator [Bacillus sp. M6-12]
MDEIDKLILQSITKNSRISMTDLGKSIGLSAPSVTERIKKLEERGVIEGYTAKVGHKQLGKNIMAYILFDTHKCKQFVQFCESYKDVAECHRLAGQYSYLVKLITNDVTTLESFIDQTITYGKSSTLIVLSSPVEQRENV